MRKIIGYLIIIFLIFLLTMQNVMGNPIPGRVFSEGRSSGIPFPTDNEDIRNMTVYLFKESVKAKINEENVKMEAEYTFRNECNFQVEIDILLPFFNDPVDINLKIDGVETSFRSSYIEYEPQSELKQGFYWGYGFYFLECIKFPISISPNGTITVNVNYSTKISIYDTSLNQEVMYWFSYLVGSARYWNHTIDEAYFEFKINKEIYDRGFGNNWNESDSGDYIKFYKTYYDWIPEDDFLGLSWERDRSSIEKGVIFISDFWRYDELRMGCITISIVFTLLVLLPIAYLKKLRKKKKRNLIRK